MGIMFLLVSGLAALFSYVFGGPAWFTVIAFTAFVLLLILLIFALSNRGTWRSYGRFHSSSGGIDWYSLDPFTDIGSSSSESSCDSSFDGGGDCGGDGGGGGD
ncbi:MAG: hypothetical protein Q7S89_01910 [bacterium]|nr:hypothetical protein [bacterium]